MKNVSVCVTTAPSPSGYEDLCDDEGVVATQGNAGGCDDGGVVATQFPGKRLDEVAKYQGNHLPHWTKHGAIYHISFRLADSVPVAKRQEWEDCRKQFAEKKRAGIVLTDDEIRQMKYLYSANVETYLDSGYGACILRNDGALAVVRETLLHDDGTRYRIHAFGVMPNHVHVIVEFFDPTMMAKVLQQWKSISAHRLNRLLHRKGEVWQIDSYNHIIRTAEEYAYQMNYVYVKNAVVGAWRRESDDEGVVATQGGEVEVGTAPAQRETTTPSAVITTPQAVMSTAQGVMMTPNGKPQGFISQPYGLTSQPQGLISQPQGLISQPQGLISQVSAVTTTPQGVTGTPQAVTGTPRVVTGTPQAVTGTPLPEDLSNELEKLKRRTSPQKIKDLILRLCKEHPMSRDDLIFYLKRGRTTIDNYLSLMIGKELDYLYPMMVHHPRQAYVVRGMNYKVKQNKLQNKKR